MSVSACAGTAMTVLAINFILTLWGSQKYGSIGGLATIQEGSCQETKTLSLWLHLAINILSTLLLSASNYCMQCLASPTREEVDRAHQRSIWLDIGVPSVRNLRQISWYKIALWWCLGLSGVPLHLLYNSAVFSSLAAVEYSVYVGSNDLFTGTAVNWSTPILGSMQNYTVQILQDASNWQRLDNEDCIKAYGQPFVSAHADLLAISPDLNSSQLASWVVDAGPSVGSLSNGIPYQWMCQTESSPAGGSVTCNINQLLSAAPSWTLPNISSPSSSTGISDPNGFGSASLPAKFAVDHCLSKPVEERCRLQFSVVIMCIVIGCNLVKTICMLLTLLYHRSQPLVTLGDAVSSFLENRDPTTENMCLANKTSFINGNWGFYPGTWQLHRHFWFSAASPKRWLICNIL